MKATNREKEIKMFSKIVLFGERNNKNINFKPIGLYLNTEGAVNIEGVKFINREDNICYDELFCEARECGECDFNAEE